MESREQACLERLVAGEDVWSEFWDLFGRLITAEILSFKMADSQLVDDVFQELVLKLLANDCQAIRTYLARPDRASFAAYLRRIVRNLMIDEYRKFKRRGELDLFNGDQQAIGALLPSRNGKPHVETHIRRVLHHVFASVAGGGPNSPGFSILCLRFIEGEHVKIIARRLDMQPNTVSHRIKYYIKKIKASHMEDLKVIADA
jgi:RNA polymerase sigma factor (sigma-70 family)